MLKDLFRRYIWLVDTVYRAESLNLTENKFVLPKDFDAEAYLYNSFGIIVYDGSPAETIRLTVKGNISGLFRCIIRRKKWKFAGNIPYSSISYPRPLIYFEVFFDERFFGFLRRLSEVSAIPR